MSIQGSGSDGLFGRRTLWPEMEQFVVQMRPFSLKRRLFWLMFQTVRNLLQAREGQVRFFSKVTFHEAPTQTPIRVPVAASTLSLLLADSIVRALTAMKRERGMLLQPIAGQRLSVLLVAGGEHIGLRLLGPPKLSAGISGHRAYFLCNDKRYIVLPNN